MADHVDPMVELEAEMKKQREAKAAEARLKAQQQALFDLNKPDEDPRNQPTPTPAASSSSSAPLIHRDAQGPAGSQASASRGTGSPRMPQTSSSGGPTQSSSNTAFIPKTWATAGREPEVAAVANHGQDLNQVSVIETESINLGMCGCGGPGGGAGTQFFAMAGLHPPSDGSFEAYFREWFERDYFPTMSADLSRELVHRARSKGFFSGLSSQVKKWAMANTDARLQSDVWCSYFLQNAPPRFRVFGPLKIANVNLGSQAVPCWLAFWGLPESEEQRLSGDGIGLEGAKWMLPPFCGGTADVSALLDELDGRGGMTALLSAAS